MLPFLFVFLVLRVIFAGERIDDPLRCTGFGPGAYRSLKTMNYTYVAFGLSIISDIELSALMPVADLPEHASIEIRQGKVPEQTKEPPLETKPFSVFNSHEFLYSIPGIARYYVQNGEKVIIEPQCGDWSSILLYFYSNCLAAVLFQRDLIPFHVSGVFIGEQKVLLFAAPSRTGKSTTAVMLEQRGYPAFTDDTAVLTVDDGKCYAQASYPMVRLWPSSIGQQTLYNESEKRAIRNDVEIKKYGFHFHEKFVTDKVEVAGIVFLEEQGTDIVVERIKPNYSIQLLGSNIYRNHWVNGMKKQVLQFNTLTNIVNRLVMWKAVRPKGQATFESFAGAIEEQIIRDILRSEPVRE